MVVIFKKKNTLIYKSSTGVMRRSEIAKAESMYKELNKNFLKLEKILIKRKLLSESGQKKNALYIWYSVGKILLRIIKEYKVEKKGEFEYFWKSIYDFIPKTIQKRDIPKRSLDWQRNHFRLCYLMAQRSWIEVQEIGNWSIWRDIFDNKKILEDERLFEWTTTNVIKLRKKGLGHKEIRKFFYAISNRLKKIDTGVLTTSELLEKLKDINFST